MQISSLNFHFRKTPVFAARRYGSSQWIEVADAEARNDHFAIFVDGRRSFEDLELIADALTAAWSEAGDQAVVAAAREG